MGLFSSDHNVNNTLYKKISHDYFLSWPTSSPEKKEVNLKMIYLMDVKPHKNDWRRKSVE